MISLSSKIGEAPSGDTKKQKAMGKGRQKSSEVATNKPTPSIMSGEMRVFIIFTGTFTAVVVFMNVSTFKAMTRLEDEFDSRQFLIYFCL